ncbi:MAG: type II secretion system GspH family protein [Planctomycetes bacterium]|nr:type II secretion system GspH family protein [Planctomycetota bacterium]
MTMTRRSGLTLTEVLVTLAILAFGILGILTLFPLAASQMAIAVREDRSAQAANAADGYIRAYWKTEFVEKSGANEPTVMSAFDNPGGGLPPAVATEPSYPVAIDPMGYYARSAPNQNWLGDSAAAKVPRRALNLLTGAQHAFRVCSQMDGLGYDDNGHPTKDRELRYNWMWVVQCPNVTDKKTATMNVVVYDNRPNLFAPAGSEGVFNTQTPHVVPGSTSLNLGMTAGVFPNVKAGQWIMDVTDPTVNTGPNKIRHANFYQVVTATPDMTGNTLFLELQKPLKKANDLAVTGAYQGKFVVLRGVTNVYPRPDLTP